MSVHACNSASREYTMGKGLRSSRGHWRPRQHPRLNEPVSSVALQTRHFGGHIRSAWAWPCAARTKARRPRHHMPDRSRQRRATQLSGRLPIFSVRHHVLPFHVMRSSLVPLRVYEVQIHRNLSFWVLNGIEPTTKGLTVSRSD